MKVITVEKGNQVEVVIKEGNKYIACGKAHDTREEAVQTAKQSLNGRVHKSTGTQG